MSYQSFTLLYNIGWERSWEEGNVQSQGIYTVSLEKEFNKRFIGFVEAFGEKALGEVFAHTLDGGLLFRPRRNLQVDIWAGKGLTAGAQDFFVGSGLAYRFPR